MSHQFRAGRANQTQLWKPSGGRAATAACFSCGLPLKWNRKIKRFMLCMDKKNKKIKNILNEHDQDNWCVIWDITNLGSYSSSRQGTRRAAPWEAVFYKQTDRDLCRRRWSKTAGLRTRAKWKRWKKKQLRRGGGTTVTTALAGWWGHCGLWQATLSASFQSLKQIISFPKPTGFLKWQLHRPARTTKM